MFPYLSTSQIPVAAWRVLKSAHIFPFKSACLPRWPEELWWFLSSTRGLFSSGGVRQEGPAGCVWAGGGFPQVQSSFLVCCCFCLPFPRRNKAWLHRSLQKEVLKDFSSRGSFLCNNWDLLASEMGKKQPPITDQCEMAASRICACSCQPVVAPLVLPKVRPLPRPGTQAVLEAGRGGEGRGAFPCCCRALRAPDSAQLRWLARGGCSSKSINIAWYLPSWVTTFLGKQPSLFLSAQILTCPRKRLFVFFFVLIVF